MLVVAAGDTRPHAITSSEGPFVRWCGITNDAVLYLVDIRSGVLHVKRSYFVVKEGRAVRWHELGMVEIGLAEEQQHESEGKKVILTMLRV
jgi:hypothetical protein